MTLALQNTVIAAPQVLGYILRSINIVLAIWTAIWALVSARQVQNRTQKARFAGLGLLALTFAWSTLFRLNAPFTIQVPCFTVALGLSAWGTLGYIGKPR